LRQPQAKILLLAPLPRGGNLVSWQQSAAANAAAFADYVDDQTVFYADFGQNFFLASGAFNGATWSNDVADRGTQPAAYEIWAAALAPWLDRFVR
jgi:hypothetical protein